MKKPLPIGVDNFEKIITNGYYFVDKTWFIKELLDNRSEVNLFTRPRRFSKTLTLSMLRYFFEKGEQDNSHLFRGLKIMEAGEKYTAQLGKYPVINLYLRPAKQPNFELARAMLVRCIRDEYNRHRYVLSGNCLSKDEQHRYRLINSYEILDNSYYCKSLLFLSQCLYRYHGQKVIILIDEYDTPLENAFFEEKDGGENKDFYKQMVSFIQPLLGSALEANKALEFAVIVGCLRINRESIFTGLNNLDVNSVLTSKYNEPFGLTQPEVSSMLDYYDLQAKEDLVKKWYDGYKFGENEVYNPWSVVNFVSALVARSSVFPKPYWINASSFSIVILKELIKRADNIVKQEIEELIAGRTIEKPVHEEINYEDIYQPQGNLWNFLLLIGYLKKTGERLLEGDIRMTTMAIPNIEVHYIFKTYIRDWFEQKLAQQDLTSLHQSLLDGDVETLTNELNQNLIESINYYDTVEAFYHGLLLGLLRSMSDAIVISNRESGQGRLDILIKIPGAKEDRAIVLELKVAKDIYNLESSCNQALKQVAERD